jgi:hypothetical protein
MQVTSTEDALSSDKVESDEKPWLNVPIDLGYSQWSDLFCLPRAWTRSRQENTEITTGVNYWVKVNQVRDT